MSGDYSPRSRQHNGIAAVPSLADPIFDPQPGFDFQDAQSEDNQKPGFQQNHRAQQQSFLNPYNPTSSSAFGGAEEYPFPAGPDGFPNDVAMGGHTLDPSNMWQQASSPAVDEFGNMFANQNQIVADRSTTVQQQYGQITPPDETIDGMMSAERAKSDKSERARNAANQRHAKSKKARKDSRLSQPSSVSDDDDHEDKKERYREKNRLAAAKCRAKKKENIETIEDRHRNLSALNNVLKKQVQELRGELTGLRTHALDHQDCNCQISKYNINQARRVAMGVDTAGSPTFPGYSQRNASVPDIGGATPSPMMDISQRRHQSYAAPSSYAFASVSTPEDMGAMPAGPEGDSQFGQFMQHPGFGHQGGYAQ